MLGRREVFERAQKFIVPKSAKDFDVARLGLGAHWFCSVSCRLRFFREPGMFGVAARVAEWQTRQT
jgi:hypothetical protein